jgi:hypothetical protein
MKKNNGAVAAGGIPSLVYITGYYPVTQRNKYSLPACMQKSMNLYLLNASHIIPSSTSGVTLSNFYIILYEDKKHSTSFVRTLNY